MSRRIDLTKPLSEADIKYLKSRGRHSEIAKSTKRFTSERVPKKEEPEAKPVEPQGDSAEKVHVDTDIFEKVKAMKIEDVRNELREKKIDLPETERASRVILAQTLQNERDGK